MADQSAKDGNPKGVEYCLTPGTSCQYNEFDRCVNCGQRKGWRNHMDKKVKIEYTMFENGMAVYGPQEIILSYKTNDGVAMAPVRDLFLMDDEIAELKYTRKGKRSGAIFVSRYKRVPE